MKIIIEYMALTMLILASGAIYYLIQAGGATDQFERIQYEGVLNLLPLLWKITLSIFFIFIYIKYKFTYINLDIIFSIILIFLFSTSLWATFLNASFFSAFNILLSYLLISLQVNIYGYKYTLEFLNKFLLSILVLSFLTIIFLPSYGISVGEHAGKWQGVFTHKNSLGLFTSLTFVFYIWLYTFNRTLISIIGIVLSFILAIGSESYTSIAAILICSLFYLLLRIPILRNLLFSYRYLIISSLIALSAYSIIISVNGEQFLLLDKDTSFSGRDKIWQYFVEEIQNSPFIGHGLDQFKLLIISDDSDFVSRVGISVMSSHNGFLDSLYSIGLIGSLFFLIRIFQLLDYNCYTPIFELSFLHIISLLINNSFEAQLIGFNTEFIFIMYIYAINKSISHNVEYR